MDNSEKHDDSIDALLERLEKNEPISSKWYEIYERFKQDTEALIEQAGGKDKLAIHVSQGNTDIYGFFLEFR